MANVQTLFFSLQFLSIFCIISFSVFPPSSCLNVETWALLDFKSKLTDPLHVLESWKESESPCIFSGISCDPISGNVTAISLDNKSLTGVLSPSITALGSLNTLSLPFNSLNGTIPGELANCSSLRVLNLTGNKMVGVIPDLSNLRNLEIIDLSLNNFSGPFPTWLGNWTALVKLGLGQNAYDESEIPENIGNMKNLTWLYLCNSNLRGEIPESIFELHELDTLDISRNKISGRFPKMIAKLQKLTQIELYANRLTGEMPPDLASLTLLREIDVSENRMYGELPEGIGALKNLKVFQLYSNNFSGRLPAGFGELRHLDGFSIYRNSFSGAFPANFGRFSPLTGIDISENQFTGNFPQFLCESRKLQYLLALQNSFSGELPQSYAGCKTLVRFRVSKNNLYGKIPDGAWALPLANIIDLGDNEFTGGISPEIQMSTSLNELILQNNNFSGVIPSEVGKLMNLEMLLLNNNSFSGEIPSAVGNLTRLSTMHLEENSLAGSIPSELSGCTKLVDLNLALNSLSGPIPEDISKMSYLNSLNLSRNQLTGLIPEDLGKLKLSSIDLSENQLSGKVPLVLLTIGGDKAFLGNKELCVDRSSKSNAMSGMSMCMEKHGQESSSGEKLVLFTIIACVMIIVLAGFLVANYRNLKYGCEADLESAWEKETEGEAKWKLSSFHHLDIDADEICDLEEENLIGSGGTGNVYRLDLRKNGGTVAVKQLWKGDALKVMSSEMEILGKIRHRNILKLYACLLKGGSSFLVFEYMPKGNLFQAIHRVMKDSRPELDWDRRYRIALGAARGISYLHHDCSPPVIHRDIKSGNILLDENYEPKIADFGVAKLAVLSRKGCDNSCLAGTHGYIAPEMAYSSKVTDKSDVYSFGVVLLELITSKRPIDEEYGEGRDLVHWVSAHLSDRGNAVKVLDVEVASLSESVQEGMLKVLKVATLCTHKLPSLRPSMREIVRMLVDAEPCSFSSPDDEDLKRNNEKPFPQ